MKIAIASDHAGFDYKEAVKAFLLEKGYEVEDFGTYSKDSCDYPDFIFPAARAVAEGKCERGIVFGGSGNGEAIAANKIKGVRCGLAWDLRSARLCREHNDANVLSMGQRMLAVEEMLEITELWLNTDYEGGRHQKRIDKLDI
ncbi:MAG: ribose 5-phosphate isomerase B [Sedimentisphaeraceae bacterium JB056]